MSGTEIEEPQITFHTEHGASLSDEDQYRTWIENTLDTENCALGRIAFIFVSDQSLHALNVAHLDHDTLTDILTFPYSYDPVEADIYISMDRVEENAADRDLPMDIELKRVMIHGVLHMCGYADKTPEEKTQMRAAEDRHLGNWSRS